MPFEKFQFFGPGFQPFVPFRVLFDEGFAIGFSVGRGNLATRSFLLLFSFIVRGKVQALLSSFLALFVGEIRFDACVCAFRVHVHLGSHLGYAGVLQRKAGWLEDGEGEVAWR